MVGRKSRREQRKPLCWLNRAGFEPCVPVIPFRLLALSGPIEGDAWHIHGAAQIRRGYPGPAWYVTSAPRFSPYLSMPNGNN
jgi:hypothetical protein